MYIHSQILYSIYPELHGYFLIVDFEMDVVLQNLADTRLILSTLGPLG